MSPRDFTPRPAHRASQWGKANKRTQDWRLPVHGPAHHTTQPSVGSQPSLLVRGIRKEGSDFSLQQNVPFNPGIVLPLGSSLSALLLLGAQERVSRASAPFPPQPPRPPLQRVDGDPAGRGADPQAEGDADTVAGEAAVQVVPVPERERRCAAGSLPHGKLHSAQSGARAFAWPGTRVQPSLLPAAPALPPRTPPSVFCSAAPGQPEHTVGRPEMGAPSSALPGAGGGGQDSREKFPEPCCSPPLPLLSGVCGREAAPQRREPGAASAQWLRSLPRRQKGRGSADPFAVTHPPNRRPERNTVTCQPSGRHLHYPTFPEPNNTHFAPGEPLGLW